MIRSFILYCLLIPVLTFSQAFHNEDLNRHLGKAKSAIDSSLLIRKFIIKNDLGSKDKAYGLLKKSKELLQNTTDKKTWADYHLDAGELYFKFQTIDKGIENYLKAYEYYKEGNSEKKEFIENRLANIYIYTGYYDQAETYLKKLYKQAQDSHNLIDQARAEANLGSLYLEEFLVKDDTTKLKPALFYSRKAYRLIDKQGDDLVKLRLNTTMADAISFTKDEDSALYYFKKALTIADQSKTLDAKVKASTYNQYARYLFDTGQVDQAVANAEKGFDLVKDGDSFIKLDMAKTLYKCYITKKDYQKATAFFEKYTDLQDSLKQMEQNANINTMVHLQENPRKDSWIEKHWAAAGSCCLLAFSLLFIGIRIKQKKKLAVAKTELLQLSQRISKLSSTIEHYEKEIDLLKEQSGENHSEREQKENQLKEILQTPILTDEQWISFKRSFEKVNTDYSKTISRNFTNVSQAELRYLYLVKLGMTHKEIASVLGISPDSVRLYKHRLGKKVQPGKENILPVLLESN